MDTTRTTSSGWGGARPGTGPKPRPVTEHRRNRMMVAFTDEEREQLVALAGDQAITAWIRELVVQTLARRPKATPRGKSSTSRRKA